MDFEAYSERLATLHEYCCHNKPKIIIIIIIII